MPRYAVLNDLTDPDLSPVGLAVEETSGVRLYMTHECGIRTDYDQPYTVREPDGEDIVYEPGVAEYFNYVLLTLSRTFLVSEIGDRAMLDSREVAEVYYEKVVDAQPAQPRHYVMSGDQVYVSGHHPRDDAAVRFVSARDLARVA